jgi:hypothetical protein
LALRQLDDVGIQPDSQKSLVIPGGGLDAGAVLENFADPRVRLSTRDLTTVLGTLSATVGLALSGAATLRFQKRVTASTFATGGSHITVTATGGWLGLDSIRADQDDEKGAVAALTLVPFYDLTNKPLVVTDSVDFDAVGAPAFTSAFFLGPAYLGASPIPGVIGSEVQFGIEFRAVRSAGQPYADQGHIVARRPKLMFRTLDISSAATITSLFGNAFGSSIHLYYWKGVSGGARVAVASTVHAKITAAAGDWTPDDISVRENQDGTLSVVVTPTGTLAMSVASAIP